MAKIYKTTDKIGIKVDDITIHISPLNYSQKMELQGDMFAATQGDMDRAMKAVIKSMKFAIKSVEGITWEDEDGNDVKYELEFSGDELTDSCVNDLLNMECSAKISAICSGLVSGAPSDKILDQHGNPMKGVSFITKGKQKKGKK